MKKKSIITRIHWNKREKRWTAKTSKGCPRFPYILVQGEWKTEVKPHLKSNPRGFVLTTEECVHFIDKEKAEALLKGKTATQLLYDKSSMTFSHKNGNEILFTPSGAYIFF